MLLRAKHIGHMKCMAPNGQTKTFCHKFVTLIIAHSSLGCAMK